MLSPFIIVTTTSDDRAVLEAMARALVDARLAACVQIGGQVSSWYRWQETVETASEWPCTIKTRRSLFPRVEQRIRELHNYETPEIVAQDLTAVGIDYLAWLDEQLLGADRLGEIDR